MASVAHSTEPLALDPDQIWRLSVDRYHAMIAKGILTEDDRVELLDGMLIEKMTKSPPHTVATDLTRRILELMIPEGWCVRIQDPITLAKSEPEPDIAIVRGTVRDFEARHPHAKEVGLVIEVADVSLSRDRGIKQRVYARAGLPTYWIINLVDRQIEIHSEPAIKKSAYANRVVLQSNETFDVVIGGKSIGKIAVYDCLPRNP